MSHKAFWVAAVAALAVLSGCGKPDAAPHKVHSRAGPISATRPSLPRPASAPLSIGRFQIVMGAKESAGIFLLDTMTGHVWRLEQKTGLKGAPYIWEHMDRLDTNADDYVFGQEHESGE